MIPSSIITKRGNDTRFRDNAATFISLSTDLSPGTLENLWIGRETDNWRVDGQRTGDAVVENRREHFSVSTR